MKVFLAALLVGLMSLCCPANAAAQAPVGGENFIPWGDFESHSGGSGKLVKGASWDGSTALDPLDRYPWFNIPLNEELKGKLRGQWLKLYIDTKGGGINIACIDTETKEFFWLNGGSGKSPLAE